MTLGELLARYDITEADLSTSLERRLSAQPDPGVGRPDLGRGGLLDAPRRHSAR